MTADSVSHLTKHLQDLMQKEFDAINLEIGLDERYYTNRKIEIKAPKSLETSSTNINNASNSLLNDDLLAGDSFNNTNNKSLNDDNNNSINEDDKKKA